LIRLGLGVLAAANLVALYFVIRPIGGSGAGTGAAGAGNALGHPAAAGRAGPDAAAGEQDRKRTRRRRPFMSSYFLPRRTAYSTIVAELNDLAGQAKITPRDSAWALDAVDGSDTLDMMQISANFEGLYPDLIHFINLLDKSTGC
jgi:hypothetical protein